MRNLQSNNDKFRDVIWESVNDEKYGTIKFRSYNKSIKRILKAAAFILIAMVSGAISSSYIIEKNYSKLVKPKGNEGLEQTAAEVPYNTVNKVAENVGPAVVGILKSISSSSGEVDIPSGSGIIFDSKGYIVTNYHIISGSKNINVRLSNGNSYLKAELIGGDSTSDLAIIKIDGKNLPTAQFGDSSKVRIGDTAIAIGNSLDKKSDKTISVGTISAANREIQYGGVTHKVFQTDAAINLQNSGGALCNELGEIIGINSLNFKDPYVEGMGFAITINQAKSIIEEIMKYGEVIRPRLGLYGRSAVSDDSNGIKGVYVNEVISGSGAQKAGVKPTDIIVEIAGKQIVEFDDIRKILEKYKIGDIVRCKIWRDGKNIEMDIVLSEIK